MLLSGKLSVRPVARAKFLRGGVKLGKIDPFSPSRSILKFVLGEQTTFLGGHCPSSTPGYGPAFCVICEYWSCLRQIDIDRPHIKPHLLEA